MKPTAIVLPSWNPEEPRFIIENTTEHTDEDRAFKNNKCVFNQRLGFAYSVSEIVEVLNAQGDEIDRIKQIINEALATERTMIGQSVLRQLLEQIK